MASLSRLTDPVLLTRIRGGDEAAFGALFERYLVRLCQFAMLYIRDMDIAEEVVSDVFAAIWDMRSTWLVETTVETYLFSAVRNRAHNVTRGEQRARQWEERFIESDETPGMGERAVAPDMAAERSDLRQRIEAVLDTLPEQSRALLSLRWLQQMDVAEIAKILGITPAAVHMQLSRAMKRLREQIPDTLR